MNKEVARIIRVDHAGEYGAIRIYTAQLQVANRLFPDIAPMLQEMLAHEKQHHERFSRLLGQRGVRTCYALPLWAIGGYCLGLFTGLLGRNAIWVCTAAIESTVLHHLQWQLQYLQLHDREAYEAVAAIQADEEAHLSYGDTHKKDSVLSAPLVFLVRHSTQFAIWLSTKL